MGPEDWKSIGEIVTYFVLGGGGVLAAQKVQAKLTGDGGDEAAALERIEAKLDKVAGNFRAVKIDVEELSGDVQRQQADLTRLSSGYREVVGRVDALESRMTRPL